MIRHFILIVLFIVSSFQAQAGSCRSVVESAESWTVFVKEPQALGPFTLAQRSFEFRHELVLKSDGKTQVAFVQGEWRGDSKVLEIEWIVVSEGFKGKRVSDYLLKKVLEQFPSGIIRQIKAQMAYDNKVAYLKELDRGEDPDRALQATPFYHTFSKLGFPKILRNELITGRDMESIEILLGP